MNGVVLLIELSALMLFAIFIVHIRHEQMIRNALVMKYGIRDINVKYSDWRGFLRPPGCLFEYVVTGPNTYRYVYISYRPYPQVELSASAW